MFQFYPVIKKFIPQFIKKELKKLGDLFIYSMTGLVPCSEFSREDVFIIGYPKSGNTWFQNMIAGVIFGIDPEYASDTLIQQLIPQVRYKRYYKRFRTPMFFSSHDLPRPEYKRVIYLLRDGRDVMVSYWHYLSALKKEKIDFLKMLRNENGLLQSKWHEHIEAWLTNPYHADMMIIKYEELKTNPVEVLKQFCKFVNIEQDEEILKKVVIKTTFEKMREKEVRYGWDNPNWPRDKFFVRRGEVGSYKDEMPKDALEFFLKEAGKTLQKCGYL